MGFEFSDILPSPSNPLGGIFQPLAGGGGDDISFGMSSQEQSLLNRQLAIIDLQLQNAGFRFEGGELVPLTEEERLSGLSPTQRKNLEIQGLLQERFVGALKGTLPVSPALERGIERREQIARTASRRKGGPLVGLSTPGIQRETALTESSEALREQARMGDLTTAAGLLAQSPFTAGRQRTFRELSGLSGLLGGAVQPFRQQRELEISAGLLRQQGQQQFLSDLLGLGGTLGTAAAFGQPIPTSPSNSFRSPLFFA